MRKNKILFIILLVMISFCITPCHLTTEERQVLKEHVPLAEAYYEEKYGTDIEIIDYSAINIIFLSEELYREGPEYDIEGEDGFYVSYKIMGENTYVTKPNYIKLADGVYITSTDSDFMYESEDFIVSSKMDLEDAISVYDKAYSDTKKQIGTDSSYGRYTPYTFDTKTGYAYKVDFSDYFKERAEDYYSSWYDFCVKIVPSELDENVISFYYYTTSEEDYPDFSEFTIEDEDITCYLYLHYTNTTDMYFCLGTDTNVDFSDDYIDKK